MGGRTKEVVPRSWASAPLVACFTIISVYQACAAPGPGWLSIDCGAPAPYTDENGIHWVPDTDFVSGGYAGTVKIPLDSSNIFNTRQLTTLRYFPDVTRVCYTIPINKSQPYLLRWTAYHGGYDNRSSFVFYYCFETFLRDVFGGYSVSDGVVWSEVIFRVPGDSVHFCLYSFFSGVAALEQHHVHGSAR